MSRVLVVDDETAILDLIKYNLEQNEYQVKTVEDGLAALEQLELWQPDLIVLDVMLPGLDGWEILRLVRNKSKVPVVMLTAKGDEVDKVLGLELGADDYLTKPFSPRELLARIRAVLRRVSQVQTRPNEEIKLGDLTIRPEQYEVWVDGRQVELTPKEFELLYCLAENKGNVLRREHILEKVWDYRVATDTRTVDVHIRYLRQKIEKDPANPRYIETVRGVGYRLRAPKTAQDE